MVRRWQGCLVVRPRHPATAPRGRGVVSGLFAPRPGPPAVRLDGPLHHAIGRGPTSLPGAGCLRCRRRTATPHHTGLPLPQGGGRGNRELLVDSGAARGVEELAAVKRGGAFRPRRSDKTETAAATRRQSGRRRLGGRRGSCEFVANERGVVSPECCCKSGGYAPAQRPPPLRLQAFPITLRRHLLHLPGPRGR